VFDKQFTSKKYSYLSKFVIIPQVFFLILHLPKHKFVSLLETSPGKGVQYVKSSGSKAIISKVDLKINLSQTQLPSGVKKVFSIYSIGSVGTTPFPNKNLKKNTNAGFSKMLGKKSLSRGVAKNPVDHPHGGRNKAIKYQRTPWGKTTKFK
jgi:large subunit ribosomal protein L2